MRTIYKYPLNMSVGGAEFCFCHDAQFLDVQMQHGNPMLWVLLDPCLHADQQVQITVYGTGHHLPDDPGEYIGTFQMDSGFYVWHVFAKRSQGEDCNA